MCNKCFFHLLSLRLFSFYLLSGDRNSVRTLFAFRPFASYQRRLTRSMVSLLCSRPSAGPLPSHPHPMDTDLIALFAHVNVHIARPRERKTTKNAPHPLPRLILCPTRLSLFPLCTQALLKEGNCYKGRHFYANNTRIPQKKYRENDIQYTMFNVQLFLFGGRKK